MSTQGETMDTAAQVESPLESSGQLLAQELGAALQAENPIPPIEHPKSEHIEPELASKLEGLKDDDRVIEAVSEYQSKQDKLLSSIEQRVHMIEQIESSGLLEAVLEPAVTQERLDQFFKQAITAVKSGDVHQTLQAIEARIDSLKTEEQTLRAIMEPPGAIDKHLLAELARKSGLPVNRLKLRFDRPYRLQLHEQVDSHYSDVSSNLSAQEHEFQDFRYRNRIKRSGVMHPQFVWPKLEAQPIEDYVDTANEAYGQFCTTTFEATLNDQEFIDRLGAYQGNGMEENVADDVKSRLCSDKMAPDQSLPVVAAVASQLGIVIPIGSEGKKAEVVMNNLAEHAARWAEELFEEASLPAYFLAQDPQLRRRLADLAVGLNQAIQRYAPTAYLNSGQPRPSMDLVAQLDQAVERFGQAVDSTNQLYIHSTPVLDRIIKSGALKPRVMVDQASLYTNTGEHSTAIHWDKEEIVHGVYSLSSGKGTFNNNQESGRSHISGVVASLGTIVEHAPYRREGVLRLEGRKHGERSEIGSDSLFMTEHPDANSGNDYEIPLRDAFLYCSSRESDNYTQLLQQSGYDEPWIRDHLIIYPSEYLNSGHGYRRIMALISRSIRPKIKVEYVIPIRSRRVFRKLGEGDNDSDSGWIKSFKEKNPGTETAVQSTLEYLRVVTEA